MAFALIAALRLIALDVDPSPRMRDAVVMDEGLWAGSARGKVLFDDYFADDHGEGYLMSPLYTHIQVCVYHALGLGLWQTRLLAALAGAGTVLLLGRWAALRWGTTTGLWTMMLGAVTQLLDQHSRIALLEMPQGFCITAAFVLLFALNSNRLSAISAGVAMAAAVAVKPNAVDFGVIPLAAAYAATYPYAHRTGATKQWWLRGGLAVVGGFIGLCSFALPVWLPYWAEFTRAAKWESGLHSYSIIEHAVRLVHPGTWTPIRDAPSIILGAWCLLVLSRAARRDYAESALMTWFLSSLFMCEIAFMPVPRRYVLSILPATVLAARFWMRRHEYRRGRDGVGGLATACGLILMPALLIKRPLETWLASQLPTMERWALPVMKLNNEDVRLYMSAWLWFAAVVVVGASIRLLPRAMDCMTRCIAQMCPYLMVALIVFEASHLGCLPPHSRTMVSATRTLSNVIPEGATVAGMFSATLLLPLKVRTVWVVEPGRLFSTPCPNPNAIERLNVEFIIDGATTYRETPDATLSGFQPLLRLLLLPSSNGARVDLILWKRR